MFREKRWYLRLDECFDLPDSSLFFLEFHGTIAFDTDRRLQQSSVRLEAVRPWVSLNQVSGEDPRS